VILWYAILTMAIATIAAIAGLVVFARGRGPNDYTILPTLAVAVLLIVQVVIMITAPFVGNPAEGDYLEIWLYLITAVAIPIGVGVWALIDKTKWANLVLTVAHFAVVVMVWRMLVLWG